MTKASKPGKPGASANVLPLTRKPGEAEADTLARCALQPSIRAAITARAFASSLGGETIDLGAMITALNDQATAAQHGDLGRAEDMLIAQAHTLDAIFNELARRAARNMGQYLNAADTYLRLALKAQSQCRATLEALATIKNPPIVYARQANIAAGPQQVNNGVPAKDARTRENESAQSELSGPSHELLPDTRATTHAVGGNPPLEAVGAFNRAEDAGR